MYAEEKAKEYFQHYFKFISDRAGVRWDSDNDAEVAAAVEYVIDAAVERIKNAITTSKSGPTPVAADAHTSDIVTYCKDCCGKEVHASTCIYARG